MTTNSKGPEEDLSGLTFEQALSRLVETVQGLESGGLALAEATRTFERGMKLARLCSEMLAAAELRIEWIQTTHGQQMRMLADQEADPPEEGEDGEDGPC